MTDPGMPPTDGAPACPFVAFDEDRDARATGPDHRHRCYAEVRPAPRALAHQEAYCLSTAFPVCPTFQDWARREAAKAKADAANEAVAHEAGEAEREGESDGDRDDGPLPGELPGSGYTSGPLDSKQRNPPRDWSAPPPWLSSRDGEVEDDEPEIQAQPPVRGGGLSGSFADRLAGGTPSVPPGGPGGGAATRPTPPPSRWAEDADADDDRDEGWDGPEARPPRARPSELDGGPVPPALPGPSWERPRRLEAYPTLKTRIGLGSLRLPPILVGVGALVLAAVALFYLPMLFIGNPSGTGDGATSSPGASAEGSGSPAAPTPTPGPTQLVYLVQEGDTMSTIADRFGVTLAALIEANREAIPNPDVLQIGQEIIIPLAVPTTLPGATPSPSPAA